MKISKGKDWVRFSLYQHRKLKQLIQTVKLAKAPNYMINIFDKTLVVV